MPYVGMTLHETVHYGLNASDSVGEEEWSTLSIFPRGFGRIHLGEERRVFNHVFWHQMHCIVSMQTAVRNRNNPFTHPPHIGHCLNYLRQTFLCAADHTLETGDFLKRDFEKDRIADTRMCRDWDMVERYLGGERIQKFFDWKHQYYPPRPSKVTT
ncbi:hypothetical protein AN958_11557 [Leucoagaricus sp. SymC.cos]|nr:hypothetical protein AN958_11557 [Leucoagaricus sp. SymC.cos]